MLFTPYWAVKRYLSQQAGQQAERTGTAERHSGNLREREREIETEREREREIETER